MEITYERAVKLTDCEILDELFTQLSNHPVKADIERINALISDGNLAFYLAKLDGKTVGMTSVISCKTATTDKLYVEDVAVLDLCRGKGVGRGLLQFAMNDSLEYFGPGVFCLTSRPSRVAARKLYLSMGFVEQETGVFRNDCFSNH